MSDQPEGPQPPRVLGAPQRKRAGRRLGAKPYWMAGGAAGLAVGVMAYAILTSHHEPQADTVAAPSSTGTPTDPNVVLAGMPSSGVIAAANHGRKATATHQAPPQGTQPPPASAPDASTPKPVDEVRQAALKDAWSRYYQDRATLEQKRRQEAQTALIADTTYQDTAGQQPGAQRQAGQGAAGGVGQASAGAQGKPAVPGSLYQGASRPADDYLDATVTKPLTPYELKAGDSVQVRFVTGVTSDAPGTWKAMVTAPVLDHATGLHILIPQGATVVGSADNALVNGSERLPAGATRIIYPGDSADSLDLGSMPLGDQAGYAALQDEVNHHYPRLIFGALLLASGGAGAQLTQPTNYGLAGSYSPQQVIASQLGLQFGQVGSQFAQQQLNAKPTHTIRPGYTATIQLTQDIAFPGEWIDGRMVPAGTQ